MEGPRLRRWWATALTTTATAAHTLLGGVAADPDRSNSSTSAAQRDVYSGMLEEGLLTLGFVVVAAALLAGFMLAERHLFAHSFAEDDRLQQRERVLAERLDADLAEAYDLREAASDSDDDYELGAHAKGRDGVDQGHRPDEEAAGTLRTKKRRAGMKKLRSGDEDALKKKKGQIIIKNIFKRRKLKESDDRAASQANAGGEAQRQHERRGGTRRRTGSWLNKMRWGSTDMEDEDDARDSGTDGEFNVEPTPSSSSSSSKDSSDSGAGVFKQLVRDPSESELESSLIMDEDEAGFAMHRLTAPDSSSSSSSSSSSTHHYSTLRPSVGTHQNLSIGGSIQ